MAETEQPTTSTPLIMAGMHRSGTSLLASAMQQAGVDIGQSLLGSSRSNKKGHFEDIEFTELHEAIFADNGVDIYQAHDRSNLTITPKRIEQAEALVQARNNRRIWGWKDPRTCLFLDFWSSLLPHAKYLFIFRRPEEVLASLKARKHPELFYNFHGSWPLKKLGFDTFRRRLAARWWLTYNQAILQFAVDRSDDCYFVELAELQHQLPAAIRHMRETWNIPVRDVDLANILDTNLLNSNTPSTIGLPWKSAEITDTLTELRHHAQSPA